MWRLPCVGCFPFFCCFGFCPGPSSRGCGACRCDLSRGKTRAGFFPLGPPFPPLGSHPPGPPSRGKLHPRPFLAMRKGALEAVLLGHIGGGAAALQRPFVLGERGCFDGFEVGREMRGHRLAVYSPKIIPRGPLIGPPSPLRACPRRQAGGRAGEGVSPVRGDGGRLKKRERGSKGKQPSGFFP